MSHIVTWLFRALLLLCLLTVTGGGLAYYLARQALPEYDVSLVVEGPNSPFEIVRDTHAVPHIFAVGEHDAFFGLGFAHAQDRLWQMTLMRRTAQGRLSEILGSDTIGIDELMRSLDLYGLSMRAIPHQSAHTLAALEAYARGVNAWLARVQQEARGRGAVEFFIFETPIAPWVPADSLAVQKLLALQLTDKASVETLRSLLTQQLPEARLRDVLSDAAVAPVLGLPSQTGWVPDFLENEDVSRHARSLYPVAPPGSAGASNAFAASGHRTAGGSPLLAVDPHLPLTAPSVWMLARMDLSAGPVIGATIPGIPAILIGRNEHLAWGLTSSYLDDQDIFIERLNPDDQQEYLTETGWRRFDVREGAINVRGGSSVSHTMRWTQNGPVIPGNHFGVARVTPPGYLAALGWTGLSEEDLSVEAAINLMSASSVREARAVGRDHLSPSLMLTLADRSTIATQMIGRQPARSAQHKTLGRVPSLAWLPENRWMGFLPYESNPVSINPESGVIAHTNNPITDAPFPEHVSFDWGDVYRIMRAERLLASRQYHTAQSFIDIQGDAVSEAARALLPLIARDLWFSDEPASDNPADRRRQHALERLANWTGEMSEHLPEPLIYNAWIRALQRRLVIDRLGAQAQLLARPNPLFLERIFRDVEGAGEWCDVVQTTRVETCSEMARLALDEALVELTESYGNRLEAWRWGNAHQALHKHQTLGRVPVLSSLVNIRHDTAGADHTLLRGQTAGSGSEPYLNVHAGGLRMVVDFSDLNSSVFIISTGQSGHFLSRHYDDLASLWRRNEYIPMSLDPDFARAGAIGVTRITPASVSSSR